jgi:Cu+-exporting ATPase
VPAPDEPVYMGLPHERYLRPKLYVAAALTLPVLILAMGEMVAPDLVHRITPRMSGWLQFILTTPVFFWAGAPFIRRWWKSIRERDPNMFTLTVTGTGAAYFYSTAAIFFWSFFPPEYQTHHGVPLYFEAAAFITTVVLLGQIIEQRAHARTDAAIRALMNLAPKVAHRLRPTATRRTCRWPTVQPGDRAARAPRAKSPGRRSRSTGTAEIDESMLTGEPLPVGKSAGGPVSAGTLNTTGSFVLRAERVGRRHDARANRPAREQAHRERGPHRPPRRPRLGVVHAGRARPRRAHVYRLGRLFAPAQGWLYGLLNAVAVLIIACPCALGLATPVSLVTGIGRGRPGRRAREGRRRSRAPGRASHAVDRQDRHADQGRPRVVQPSVIPASGGFRKSDLLTLAAAAESPSEHPLARAIVAAAAERGLALPPVTEFSAEPGFGVRANVDGKPVVIGRAPVTSAPSPPTPSSRSQSTVEPPAPWPSPTPSSPPRPPRSANSSSSDCAS